MYIIVYDSMLQYSIVYYSILQYAVVCCSLLQYIIVCYNSPLRLRVPFFLLWLWFQYGNPKRKRAKGTQLKVEGYCGSLIWFYAWDWGKPLTSKSKEIGFRGLGLRIEGTLKPKLTTNQGSGGIIHSGMRAYGSGFQGSSLGQLVVWVPSDMASCLKDGMNQATAHGQNSAVR